MNEIDSVIGIVFECAQYGLWFGIVTSVTAGLLAVVVLAINLLLRRWITPGQMGLLWGIVLLRLFLLFAPASSFSLQQASQISPVDVIESVYWLFDSPDSGVSHNAVAPPSVDVSGLEIPPDESVTSKALSTSQNVAASNYLTDRIFEILSVVWLVGALVCLTWTVAVHCRFHHLLKSAIESKDVRLLELWAFCCSRACIRRKIKVLLLDRISQPSIMGFFRPRLLLPPDILGFSDEQLKMIMLHELAHVRRWDIAVNWGLALLRIVHWWSPVYWLAAGRFQNLREQACDAYAIQQIEGHSTRGYGELLLSLALRQPASHFWRVALPASILGFFSSYFQKKSIQNRLKSLSTAAIQRSPWQLVGFVGLVIAMVVSGLTDPNEIASASSKISESPFSDWLPGEEWQFFYPSHLRVEAGVSETRAYDIQRVVERISKDTGSSEKAREELRLLIVSRLMELAGRGGEPPGDQDRECVSINGDNLSVTAPIGYHKEIVQELSAWEVSGVAQNTIGIDFFTDEHDIASKLGFAWQIMESFPLMWDAAAVLNESVSSPVVRARSVVDSCTPIAVATLSREQAAEIRQLPIMRRPGPRITVFNGQRGVWTIGRRRPFVVGIQNLNNNDPRKAKVGEVEEGFKFVFRAIQGADSNAAKLEAHLETSVITDVTTTTIDTSAGERSIQLPRVKRSCVDVSSEVMDQGAILIDFLPSYEQKKHFYVLLTVICIKSDSIFAD